MENERLFFNLRFSSNNTNLQNNWNLQYNNSLISNFSNTASPLTSKNSKNVFRLNKRNANSSVFNTFSLIRKTYFRIKPLIKNNPEVEVLTLNFALLKQNSEKLDSIIYENPNIIQKPKTKRNRY